MNYVNGSNLGYTKDIGGLTGDVDQPLFENKRPGGLTSNPSQKLSPFDGPQNSPLSPYSFQGAKTTGGPKCAGDAPQNASGTPQSTGDAPQSMDNGGMLDQLFNSPALADMDPAARDALKEFFNTLLQGSSGQPSATGGAPQGTGGGAPQGTGGGAPQGTGGGAPQGTDGGAPQSTGGGAPQSTGGDEPQSTDNGGLNGMVDQLFDSPALAGMNPAAKDALKEFFNILLQGSAGQPSSTGDAPQDAEVAPQDAEVGPYSSLLDQAFDSPALGDMDPAARGGLKDFFSLLLQAPSEKPSSTGTAA